jgi:hypothetical protein
VPRPQLLTDKVISDVELALKNGAYLETAAAFAGVNTKTFRDWLTKGAKAAQKWEKDDNSLTDNEKVQKRFHDVVKKALAEIEVTLGTLVLRAARGGPVLDREGKQVGYMQPQWTAAMTMLERRFAGRWSRVNRHEVTGSDGGPVEVDTGSTDRILGALASLAGRDGVGSVVEAKPAELVSGRPKDE